MADSEEPIGDRLRKARIQKNLSLPEVTQLTGIVPSNLSAHEKNRSKPSCDALLAYSQLYGVTTDWILKGGTPNQESMICETPGIYDTQPAVSTSNKELQAFLSAIIADCEQGDEYTMGWVIVQLRNAFPDIARRLKNKELK